MNKSREIFVHGHWAGMPDPLLIGVLHAYESGNKQVCEFEYAASWLKSFQTSILDPQLRAFTGKFFPSAVSGNFGVFVDSTPGTWGRALLQRYEVVAARKAQRPSRQLNEIDHLLGVFDFYRSGALRYKTDISHDFVTSDEQFILPSFSNLRDLEQASLQLETENSIKEFDSSMSMLVASGAVLGGKRAKATVIDNDWLMWMAKFPSVHDTLDCGGWEFVAHTMAGLSGIQTVPSMMKKLNHHHHAFIVQRFDRTKRGERLHYASATTLLGYTGNNSTTPSYLDMAAFIIQHGAEVAADLEELWRRMVFNIAIRNTDDHLNNHGFLMNEKGWKLSPVFDLNPDPQGRALSLNISESDNALSLDLAMRVAPYFRVPHARAKKIADEIQLVKSQWNKFAADAGLTKAEQEKMSGAFE